MQSNFFELYLWRITIISVMDTLNEISNRLINQVKNLFTRSLANKIDWTERLIEIRGSRGVGKTTLLLQRAKSIIQTGGKVVYVSLDLPHFFSHSLYEFADTFVKYGGEYLFLDEVHRYPAKHKDSDWSLEIKNIYDSFPNLKIVYSGSSILHLYQGMGDLSRRKAAYLLHGLSFREYLEINCIKKYPAYAFEEILSSHQNIASKILEDMKPLVHFKKYLKSGYYPFFKGNEPVYFKQLQDVVNLIIDSDIPYQTNISNSAREQLKRLLGAISSTVPYVPNMNTLGELLQISDHRTLLKYLLLLEEAQLIYLVRTDAKGNKQMQKPDKILINNSNLMYALGMKMNETGTQRETFFYNQLSYQENISYSAKADFIVNNTYIFEIGGKSKGNAQIKDLDKAYVAADDLEIGFGNKIPIWLFGFLY